LSSFRTIELSDPSYETGGLRFLTVKTPNLKGRGDICLYVPPTARKDGPLPIYILLHGVYGSAWAWAMKGGAAQTAQRLMQTGSMQPAIIAMPSDGLWGDGSAYFAHHGFNFEQWIIHDVPQAIIENIPEADKQASLCIGGLSMGGYGALCLGMKHPEKFKAISAHSSITKLEQMSQFVEEPLEAYASFTHLPDVLDIAQKQENPLPPLRFDCGVQDNLLDANRLLHQQLSDLDIPHTYEEFAGGHEWPYWQKQVQKTFSFFDQHCS